MVTLKNVCLLWVARMLLAKQELKLPFLRSRLGSGMNKTDLVKYWESSAFLDQSWNDGVVSANPVFRVGI